MSVFGIMTSRKEQADEIERALALEMIRYDLDGRIQKRWNGPPDGSPNIRDGMDSSGQGLHPENADGADPEEILYVFLYKKKAAEMIAEAQRLWEKYPSLPIIGVIEEAKDIFASLKYPFFHIIRFYALESDMQVAVQKIKHFRPPGLSAVVFSCGNGSIRLRLNDILYLDSDRHEIRIHTTDGIIGTTEPISQCEIRLDKKGFVRIHKSYLVNMYHIVSLENNCVRMSNGERLYISRARGPEVKRRYQRYIRRLEFM